MSFRTRGTDLARNRAPRKDFVVPKSQSGLSAGPCGPGCEVGEGTKVLGSYPELTTQLTRGQKAQTITDLSSGSSRLNRGVFPGVGKRGGK